MPKQRRAEAVWAEKRSRWHIKPQVDGERKSFYSSTPGRRGKHEAEYAADAWIESHTEKDRHFGDLWTEFIKYKQENTSKSNWTQLEYLGRMYLLPTLAGKRVSSITRAQLQSCINAMAKRGLSKRSCTNLRNCISAFATYCADRRLPMEPQRLTVPQSAPVGTRNIVQPDGLCTLMTDDTIMCRGKQIKSFYIYAYRFFAVTGLRRGELCGLRNDDIAGRKATITRAINHFGEETRGKNNNARRDVSLSDHALAILEQQRAMLCELGIKSEWVFPKQDGTCTNSNTLLKNWKAYCAQHGTSSTLHELRHTYISVCKADMPMELLKAQVGHSVAMDTTGIYGHEVAGERDRIAQITDDIFVRILANGGKQNE